MSIPSRELCGVIVPDTPLVARAMEEARAVSEPYLFNHAVRSWLFAVQIANQQSAPYDEEVVAVSSLLHDLGLTKAHAGTRRFEVEGAGVDYAGFLSERIPKGTMANILAAFPRLQMKRQLKDCLCDIARARPQTTYENFLRDFGERFVAGYKPSISTVDLLENAPFDE
jgi:hypothetical protein